MLSENIIRSVIKLRRIVPTEKKSIVKLCNPYLFEDLLFYYNNENCPHSVKIVIRNLFENANKSFDRSNHAMENIAHNYFDERSNTEAIPADIITSQKTQYRRYYRGVAIA